MALPHQGSWGTPELGFTERLSNFFGQGRTDQGGSNMYGDQSQTTLVPSGTNAQGQPSFAPLGQSGAYGRTLNTGSSVLGAQSNTTGSSGSSSGGSYADQWRALGGTGDVPVGWTGENQVNINDRENQIRNEINSGYDAYFGQLDSILNEGLPSQRTAQENIAQSQYNQGFNTLSNQRDSSISDLGRETEKTQGKQKKTLKDIADNLTNAFNAGNVFLGSRGAGDSTAANQYSYALTKLGSQQRGDVNSQYADIFSDINQRTEKVKNIFNTESNNLQEQLNQQINSIGAWFAEQQNALRQAKAQGQLSRGQDLAQLSQNMLNQALQQVQMVQAEAMNRRSALEQWAMNNSQNVNQLASNMGQLGQTNYNSPQAQRLTGQPTMAAGGSFYMPGYNSGSNEDLFRNRLA